MLRRDHLKTKLVSFILLDILLCFAFFILPEFQPDREWMWSGLWYLRLLIVYYPLTAILYGITIAITAFRDRGYIALMAVIFLACAVINGIVNDVVEVPASLVYTAMMLAAMLLTIAVKALILMLIRKYKQRNK